MDDETLSACVSICTMEFINDGIEEMCIGCGRTMDEIVEFTDANNKRRIEINETALSRLHTHRIDK